MLSKYIHKVVGRKFQVDWLDNIIKVHPGLYELLQFSNNISFQNYCLYLILKVISRIRYCRFILNNTTADKATISNCRNFCCPSELRSVEIDFKEVFMGYNIVLSLHTHIYTTKKIHNYQTCSVFPIKF